MSEVWSVRLLPDEESMSALARPGAITLDASVGRLSLGGWGGDGIDDAPYIEFQLQAANFEAAVEYAQHFVDEVLRGQSVTPRQLQIAWAAPVRGTMFNGDSLLAQAKELYDAERYELAVVAAQMHFEAQLRYLMERAAERAGTVWAGRLLKVMGVATLSSEVSRAAAELLLELDVTRSQFWPAYDAHRVRRNAVTHRAQQISANDARASIEVVQAFWAELAAVERAKTLF
jgi:HEPN domain-containing protein